MARHPRIKLRQDRCGIPSIIRPHAIDGFTFSKGLWKRVAKEYWERRPVLIKHPFRSAMISPKEMFAAVMDAAARYRKGERNAQVAFQIEGKRVEADPRKFLPQPGDRAMSGYVNRLARMLRGRWFALIIEEIQMEAPQVWLRFREFLCGLSRVGIVPARVKASVFVGNYKITPAGLHRGNSANFKFVVQGRKKLHLWPDKLFHGRKNLTGTLDVGRLLSAATTLEGHAGDIIYWPSDRWHVAECVGGLAVSVSLALYIKERPPGPSAKVARLNCATSFGFSQVPDPLPHRQLKDNAVIRAHPHYPIIWLAGRDNEVICSANGHAFSVAAHPEVLKLLKELNRGNALRVGALIGQHSGDAQVGRVTFKAGSEDIRALLEKLYCLRAIS
jgi:hypothetical protein